jgi:hypothetical protein
MPTMTYGEAAIPIAKRELGVKERPPGSNDGPRVRTYLQGHAPEPWCADFGTWVLKQVGFPQPTWNWSYCPSWAQAAARGDAGMRTLKYGEAIQPGDVALYDWQGDGIMDHWGLVESVSSANAFRAIEGNTSVGNDSNGGEVMLRTRFRSDVGVFVRLPQRPAPTLAERIRGAGYGVKSVQVILRNLKAGISGSVPRPTDREMFQKLRAQGLGAESARKVIKSVRKKKGA